MIGEGGQASVFAWEHQGQSYAVKVALTREDSDRIQQEAETLKEVAGLDPQAWRYVIQNLGSGVVQGCYRLQDG
jgi:predicted Ser/Thr protein kinase